MRAHFPKQEHPIIIPRSLVTLLRGAPELSGPRIATMIDDSKKIVGAIDSFYDVTDRA